MKLRLHIVLPPPGSRARLPLLLAAVLGGMAAVQLAYPERIDLPPGGAVAQIGMAALPTAPMAVTTPPLLASRDLFAPAARQPGEAGPSDPLSGAVIAGVVQKGRLRLGVVQQPGGQVRYVGIGGTVAGWRLAALGQGDARLTRGVGQTLRVGYGMRAVASSTAGTGNPASPQATESGQ